MDNGSTKRKSEAPEITFPKRKDFIGKKRTALLIFSLVAGVSLLYGLFTVIGNPVKFLLNSKLDRTRESDIANLKSSIEAYYSKFRSMPTRLWDLKINYPYISEKTDPETGKEYDYHWNIGTRSYNLCATFSGASHRNTSLDHPKGYHCFSLNVPYSAPISTPTVNPQESPLLRSCKLDLDTSATSEPKIMGIYEFNNSVLFTTNKIVSVYIIRWEDFPGDPIVTEDWNKSIFDLADVLKFKAGTRYRLRVYKSGRQDRENMAESESYIFQGDRTVQADPRCEYSIFPTPTNIRSDLIKFLSIEERTVDQTRNAIEFVTNKPVYAKLYTWSDPRDKNEETLEKNTKFVTTSIQPEMAYQIKIYEVDESSGKEKNSVLSDVYLFKPSRIVF